MTQAYGGKFSHKGSNKYAVDWKMPEGTPVHASRAGLVVKTKDDSAQGGKSLKFDRYNNYVLIRHNDGTLGHYCHLQKGGVKVKPGDMVEAVNCSRFQATQAFQADRTCISASSNQERKRARKHSRAIHDCGTIGHHAGARPRLQSGGRGNFGTR